MENQFDELYDFLRNKLEFRLIREDHIPESFGNRYAVFSQNDFLIRIVLDRSEFRVEFTSTKEPNHFFDSDLVIQLLHDINADGAGDSTHEDLMTFILSNLNYIKERFDENNYEKTKLKLKVLANDRFNKYFGK